MDQAGGYQLLVSNAAGSVTSEVAGLSIIALERIVRLTLAGVVGSNYQVDFSDKMGNPPLWTPLTNFVLTASPFELLDRQSATVPQRFYRMTLAP